MHYDLIVIGDSLQADPDDWRRAAGAYAAEHARYYGVLHTMEDWLTDLIYAPGPQAAQRRGRIFELHAKEPGRAVDIVGVGPDTDVGDAARRRFWGEDRP